MRVSLITATATYPLAGETGVDERVFCGAVDFRLEASIQRQPLARLRAATAGEKDRQNLTTTITFGTRRVFATALAAFHHAADYDAAGDRAGTLRLDTVSPGGTVVSREMPGAVVSPPRRRLDGCTLWLDYTVRGGGIEPGAGASTTRILAEDGGVELDEDGGDALTEE